MGSKVKLGNLLSLLTDYHANGAYKKLKENVELFDEPDYAVMIRTTNFEQNNFDSNLKYISEHAYNFLEKSKVKAGDIIMNKIANAGSSYLMPDLNCPVSLAMNLFLLRIDEDKANSTFVYLYLKLNEDYVKSFANGSVTKTITKEAVRNLEIELPERSMQDYIVKVYMDYVSKLTLNQKTNQTLEQMAQALFKSWFVDFDPVFDNLLASVDFNLDNLETSLPDELILKAQRRLATLNSLENAAQYKASLSALAHELQAQLPTKEAPQATVSAAETPVKANLNGNPKILVQHAKTHAHFPNEFEHNEQLGWIPKGWEASKLKEFGKIITGKTPPKKIDDAFDLEGKGVPFITPSDVEGDVFTVNAIRHLTESGVGSVKNNIVDAESVCVTCIGSQMGKTTITPVKSVTNQQLNSIVLGEKYLRDYIFLNLRMRREELFNLGSSGSTMPILNKTSFENLSVLKPNESSLKAFDDITESYLAKILLNSQNNTKLTTMRDTLLPKLISGELQVPDVAIDEELVG